MRLFDPSLPLHLLKGEERGLDIHLFIDFVHATTGRRPSLITPSQLRVLREDSSPTGFGLFCVNGVEENGSENLERIYQVGLELHQRELRKLPQSTLREISRVCFNDFRTVFLVHDKRMLGLVLEELNKLVDRKVLTPGHARILRDGVTPTKIPGSSDIQVLIRQTMNNPGLKDEMLLKPIRSGKGDGIAFGTDMTLECWMSQLQDLANPELIMNKVQYVVQRDIKQPRYDMLSPSASQFQSNHLVGTYMAVHGEFVGLGLWRTSPDRICAVSSGGAWICSVLSARSEMGNRPQWSISRCFVFYSSLVALWKSIVDVLASFPLRDLFFEAENGHQKSPGK